MKWQRHRGAAASRTALANAWRIAPLRIKLKWRNRVAAAWQLKRK